MSVAPLHHLLLGPENASPDRALFVLHGILGTGTNLRPVAQTWLKADPRYLAVLVDLPQHGRSQGRPGPYTVDGCAAELEALSGALSQPVRAVVGHSFGGKVALAFHGKRPDLERVVLLDSAPGARPDRHGSADTLAVVEMLERAPSRFTRRDEFIAYVHSQGHSRMVADWLAMNLERTDDGFRLRLNLPSIRALLDDYFTQDYWWVLENSRARIDIVIGARSGVWDDADRTRAVELAHKSDGRVRVHVLPNAGHWVHVEDFRGVAAAISAP